MAFDFMNDPKLAAALSAETRAKMQATQDDRISRGLTSKNGLTYATEARRDAADAEFDARTIGASEMQTGYQIPASHYDSRTHQVSFQIGADFTEKLEAYKADGFEYCLAGDSHFLVRKVMR